MIQTIIGGMGLLLLGALIGAKLSEIFWDKYNQTLLELSQIRSDILENANYRIEILEEINILSKKIIENDKKIIENNTNLIKSQEEMIIYQNEEIEEKDDCISNMEHMFYKYVNCNNCEFTNITEV